MENICIVNWFCIVVYNVAMQLLENNLIRTNMIRQAPYNLVARLI